MSAGICGKRVGFEEIFGSSSPTSCSKRSRWSGFGSPTRSDFGVAAQGPSFDDFNVRVDSVAIGNCSTVPDERTATCSQMSHETVEEAKDVNSAVAEGNRMHGSKWVNMFVQEMTSAVDLDDARIRSARILEAFEHNITAYSRESEELKHGSLKEHFQSLVNDNQILKRASSHPARAQSRARREDERSPSVKACIMPVSRTSSKFRGKKLHIKSPFAEGTICFRTLPPRQILRLFLLFYTITSFL